MDEVYPILYIDAIHYSVRDNGVIRKLAAYVILGINTEGKKEVLSITVGDNESSKYWLSVLNELKNRGVKDILIICADGLSGIKEAIAAAFPKTEYQRCIVHQVRNTLKYVPDKDRKAFASDLKTIYHASDEEKARLALDRVTEKWTAKYPNSMERWYDNWDAITPIFKFSPDVRKVIYTTNAIESLNSTYRKLNRQRSVFPSDYIISRMDREDEQTFLSEFPEDCSTLILLQLLFRYEGVKRKNGRIFKFTQHNLMKVHYETPEESEKCQSRLTEEQVKEVGKMIRSKLSEKLRNRLLGKVYIEPSMKNYTLPLAENTLQGGLGVLSKGSRIPIDEGKKLRAFTYWEKVNDIDLSVFALTEDGNRREFSWRTMSRHQSGAITYSGDQTSGYLGGSEYFDINLPEFKAQYSEYRYLIFCDNVYSGKNFNKCFCKAGYMLRDWDDSGQVYEPKTVKSAYLVNCESTFAYLFGIDLFTNEFVWLNVAKNSKSRVAGDTNLSFLTDYFHLTDVMNMYDFFSMMAEKIVEDPMEADVVVTDHEVKCTEEAQIIREYDFEKIRMLMEDAK